MVEYPSHRPGLVVWLKVYDQPAVLYRDAQWEGDIWWNVIRMSGDEDIVQVEWGEYARLATSPEAETLFLQWRKERFEPDFPVDGWEAKASAVDASSPKAPDLPQDCESASQSVFPSHRVGSVVYDPVDGEIIAVLRVGNGADKAPLVAGKDARVRMRVANRNKWRLASFSQKAALFQAWRSKGWKPPCPVDGWEEWGREAISPSDAKLELNLIALESRVSELEGRVAALSHTGPVGQPKDALWPCFGQRGNLLRVPYDSLPLPLVGGTYRHYKGDMYEVTQIVRNADNADHFMVIYRSLNPHGGVWARRLEDWHKPTERGGQRYTLEMQTT